MPCRPLHSSLCNFCPPAKTLARHHALLLCPPRIALNQSLSFCCPDFTLSACLLHMCWPPCAAVQKQLPQVQGIPNIAEDRVQACKVITKHVPPQSPGRRLPHPAPHVPHFQRLCGGYSGQADREGQQCSLEPCHSRGGVPAALPCPALPCPALPLLAWVISATPCRTRRVAPKASLRSLPFCGSVT